MKLILWKGKNAIVVVPFLIFSLLGLLLGSFLWSWFLQEKSLYLVEHWHIRVVGYFDECSMFLKMSGKLVIFVRVDVHKLVIICFEAFNSKPWCEHSDYGWNFRSAVFIYVLGVWYFASMVEASYVHSLPPKWWVGLVLISPFSSNADILVCFTS